MFERNESQPALNWPVRQRIALGSARGLAYLHDHCDPNIIHRDVKAANILLDEEFEAVVGDFGLSKLMDYRNAYITTAVRGTIGHIAPEAFDLAPLATDDDAMLLDWVKGLLKDKKLELLVDADLQGSYVDEQGEELIQPSSLPQKLEEKAVNPSLANKVLQKRMRISQFELKSEED
ncbi:hypothetical protein POM88_051012 [Heracleum sosnowskyi]|uniref:non-specific serine/threonine protein kinase n=1 Tax=Heracleum sosnowskyi TaxID=360622 RepID=A0AAD8GZS0_9APIA|nr:hypothetical protein POM88_051012 [Heracleum sosnowskyi]